MAQVMKSSFEDRLARIQTGGPNTMGEVHIGPVPETRARSKAAPNTVRVKSKKKRARTGPNAMLVIPVALLIGALCMFAGQVAAYHFFGGGLFPVEIPVEALKPYVVYANFAVAGLLALLFTWTFGFSTLVRQLAVILGLASVYFFEGDLVERFPGVYTAMYSEAYLQQAQEPRLENVIAAVQERLRG